MSTVDDILNASNIDDDLAEHIDLDLEALLETDDSDDMIWPDADAIQNDEINNTTNGQSMHAGGDNGLDNVSSNTKEEDRLNSQFSIVSLETAEKAEQFYLHSCRRSDSSALQGPLLSHKVGGHELFGEAPPAPGAGSLKYLELDSLSAQLQRIAMHTSQGPGAATVLVVCAKYIAVGTTRGFVLLFDHNQDIRHVLGTRVDNTSRPTSSVTALDVPTVGDVALVGYSTGEVAVYDIEQGVILKRFTNVHSHPICRICLLKPLTSSTTGRHVISVDSKGCVYRLHFTPVLAHSLLAVWSALSALPTRGSVTKAATATSECVLDGGAGPIVDLCVLPHGSLAGSASNPTYPSNLQIISFHSLTRTYIVQIQPTLQVVHRWAMNNSNHNSTIPVSLDWGWVNVAESGLSGGKIENHAEHNIGSYTRVAVLARARRNCIQWLACLPTAITTRTNNSFTFVVLSELHLPGSNENGKSEPNIMALKWLDRLTVNKKNGHDTSSHHNLCVLTDHEAVIITVCGMVLERISLTPEICASYTRLLAPMREAKCSETTTTTSHTMPLIISHTAVSNVSRVYTLYGQEDPPSFTKAAYFSVQTWQEQVDKLIQESRWLEALGCAISHVSPLIKSLSSTYKNYPHAHNGELNETSEKDEHSLLSLVRTSTTVPMASSDVNVSAPIYSAADVYWLEHYIMRYLALAVSHSSGQENRSHYSRVAGVCIDYCVLTGLLELLFGDIFHTFSTANMKDIFVETLEPFIVSRRIRSIPNNVLYILLEASPSVTESTGDCTVSEHMIVESASSEYLQCLERCFCYLHFEENIVEFILLFLKKAQLWSAYLYVHGYFLQDLAGAFVVVFDALTVHMTSSLSISGDLSEGDVLQQLVPTEGDHKSTSLAFKALLFLSYAAGGQVFPRGDTLMSVSNADILPSPMHTTVDDLLMQLLQDNRSASHLTPLSKMRFPYLSVLCAIDVESCFLCLSQLISALSVVSMASHDYHRNIADVYNQLFDFVCHLDQVHSSAVTASPPHHYTLTFFKILGQKLCSCPVLLSRDNWLSEELMQSIISYCKTVFLHQSTADTLISSLFDHFVQHVNGRNVSVPLACEEERSLVQYEPHRLLAMRKQLEEKKYWRAMVPLYCCYARLQTSSAYVPWQFTCKDFDTALHSFISDNDIVFRRRIFVFIHEMFDALFGLELADESGKSMQDLDELHQGDGNTAYNPPSCIFGISCIKLILTLNDIDPKESKNMLTKYCLRTSDHIVILLETTKKYPSIQLDLLEHIVNSINESDEYSNEYLSELFTQQQVSHYVRLLSVYRPQLILGFLLAFPSAFVLDDCLLICREKQIFDATALLLEKAGDCTIACDLLLKELSRRVTQVRSDIDIEMKSLIGFNNSFNTSSNDAARVMYEAYQQYCEAMTLTTVNYNAHTTWMQPLYLQFQDISVVLKLIIGLCSRHFVECGGIKEKQGAHLPSGKPSTVKGGGFISNQELWYMGFDSLLRERHALKSINSKQQSDLTGKAVTQQQLMLSFALEVTIQLIGENIKTYLNAMKECVAPQDIMRRFVASGSNNSNQAGGGSSTIGEFKDVLINMVQADTFDVFVGECLVRMNFTDLTTLHRQKTQLMNRGHRVTEVTRAQLMQMEAETAARKALAELDEEDRMSVGVDERMSLVKKSITASEASAVNLDRMTSNLKKALLAKAHPHTSSAIIVDTKVVTVSSLLPSESTFRRRPGSLPPVPQYTACYNGSRDDEFSPYD